MKIVLKLCLRADKKILIRNFFNKDTQIPPSPLVVFEWIRWLSMGELLRPYTVPVAFDVKFWNWTKVKLEEHDRPWWTQKNSTIGEKSSLT